MVSLQARRSFHFSLAPKFPLPLPLPLLTPAMQANTEPVLTFLQRNIHGIYCVVLHLYWSIFLKFIKVTVLDSWKFPKVATSTYKTANIRK